MSVLTVFGVFAVTAMLVLYALEERAPAFVLLFAVACAASSLYGFLQGAWPFGVVEAVWTGVAIRRWRARVRIDSPTESRPIACNMSALTPTERRRYDDLRSRITASVTQTISTKTSVQLQLDHSVPLPEVAEWITLEHRCCPFLNITVSAQADDTRWVELGGAPRSRISFTANFPSRTGSPLVPKTEADPPLKPLAMVGALGGRTSSSAA